MAASSRRGRNLVIVSKRRKNVVLVVIQLWIPTIFHFNRSVAGDQVLESLECVLNYKEADDCELVSV